MADRRFYFWESYAKAFSLLTDEEAGRFIKACSAFAFEGTVPDFSDSPKMAFAWEMVSGQIERSVEIGIKNSERGKQGGRPPKRAKKSGAKSGALSGAKSGVKSTAKSGAESGAESDMYMNTCVAASLGGSAAPQDGGDSDEY